MCVFCQPANAIPIIPLHRYLQRSEKKNNKNHIDFDDSASSQTEIQKREAARALLTLKSRCNDVPERIYSDSPSLFQNDSIYSVCIAIFAISKSHQQCFGTHFATAAATAARLRACVCIWWSANGNINTRRRCRHTSPVNQLPTHNKVVIIMIIWWYIIMNTRGDSEWAKSAGRRRASLAHYENEKNLQYWSDSMQVDLVNGTSISTDRQWERDRQGPGRQRKEKSSDKIYVALRFRFRSSFIHTFWKCPRFERPSSNQQRIMSALCSGLRLFYIPFFFCWQEFFATLCLHWWHRLTIDSKPLSSRLRLNPHYDLNVAKYMAE